MKDFASFNKDDQEFLNQAGGQTLGLPLDETFRKYTKKVETVFTSMGDEWEEAMENNLGHKPLLMDYIMLGGPEVGKDLLDALYGAAIWGFVQGHYIGTKGKEG